MNQNRVRAGRSINMATSRIEIFEQMLAGDPANTMVMFGLAKEYEKSGDHHKVIETLERYLAAADDEGNAYGMLAAAYGQTNQADKARAAYERGVEVSMAHGHPGMAEDYRQILTSEYSAP